jgi:hypothetical protein
MSLRSSFYSFYLAFPIYHYVSSFLVYFCSFHSFLFASYCDSFSGALSPLCSMQLGRGWVRQNTIVYILFIKLMTCFAHYGPSSGHKMYNEENYTMNDHRLWHIF